MKRLVILICLTLWAACWAGTQVWAGPGSSSLEDELFSAPPAAKAQPFSVRIVEQPQTAKAGEAVQFIVELEIPDEHWVYQERTRLEVVPSPGFEILEITAPESERKFDPFLEKEVEVYKHTSRFQARLRPGWQDKVQLVMHYQGCNNTFCYFPQADTLAAEFELSGSAPVTASDAGDASTSGLARVEEAAQKGFLWLLILAFTAGFATSLTPCVYPMIPITIGIIGARSAGSRSKGFSLSLLYVLGIAFTYSALGTTAAITGSLFGNALQNVWVVVFIAVVFTLMAMSMFGAFELQVPAGMAGRLNAVQGNGYPGAFLLGLIAGIVASPCIGPVLVGLLAYVGAQGNALLGFSLFFTFALGLGVLFVVLGTFTGMLTSLPKSGDWMVAVKTVFGLVFLGVALYYIHPLLPDPGRLMWITGGVLLLLGLWFKGWRRIHEAEADTRRWSKALGRVALVAGLYAVTLPLWAGSGSASIPGPAWLASEAEGWQLSRDQSKPLLVDFSAEWCGACKELEHRTFSDRRVIDLSQSFVTVRVDATRQTEEIQSLMQKYGIRGLPWVAFVTPDGDILENLTVTGFIEAGDMLERMQEALEASRPQAAKLGG